MYNLRVLRDSSELSTIFKTLIHKLLKYLHCSPRLWLKQAEEVWKIAWKGLKLTLCESEVSVFSSCERRNHITVTHNFKASSYRNISLRLLRYEHEGLMYLILHFEMGQQISGEYRCSLKYRNQGHVFKYMIKWTKWDLFGGRVTSETMQERV